MTGITKTKVAMMSSANGFWSYVHADDAAEGGRISQLARDVVDQYEMITGDSISLFLDRETIEWGDEWRPKVDKTLADIAFFIPVITRRYFQSPECRRELNFFTQNAKALGVAELIMPILYVDFPALREDPPSDDAIARARSFQWVDWTDLRFAALDSPEYRRAVAGLAERLAEATATAEQTEISNSAAALEAEIVGDRLNDDDAGFVDLVAKTEGVLPEWADTMNRIVTEIEQIGNITTATGEEIKNSESQGQGFIARNTILTRLSQELREPASQIATLGNKFAAQLHEVDLGMQAIIERISGELAERQESVAAAIAFSDTIRLLASNAAEGLGALDTLVSTIEPVERESRNLRPVLRELRKGLTLMVDGNEVIQNWVKLIDGWRLTPSADADSV